MHRIGENLGKEITVLMSDNDEDARKARLASYSASIPRAKTCPHKSGLLKSSSFRMASRRCFFRYRLPNMESLACARQDAEYARRQVCRPSSLSDIRTVISLPRFSACIRWLDQNRGEIQFCAAFSDRRELVPHCHWMLPPVFSCGCLMRGCRPTGNRQKYRQQFAQFVPPTNSASKPCLIISEITHPIFESGNSFGADDALMKVCLTIAPILAHLSRNSLLFQGDNWLKRARQMSMSGGCVAFDFISQRWAALLTFAVCPARHRIERFSPLFWLQPSYASRRKPRQRNNRPYVRQRLRCPQQLARLALRPASRISDSIVADDNATTAER